MADTPDPTQPTPAPQPARAPSWLAPFAPLILRAAAIVAAAALGAIGTYFGVPPKEVEKIKEVLVPMVDEWADKVNRDGVVHDAEANDADARAAQFKTFADTPAGKVGDGELPKQVYGWKAVEKLTGKPTPLKDQNPTGSCVGFGNTSGVEHTLAAEILARKGDPSEFTFFSEEVTYAAGKVQGARSMGASVSRQDGSATVFVKAWFALPNGGMVPKGKYGSYDLTKYDAARAKSWNLSGPPPEVLAVAKKYPVKDSVKITSWEQAKRAMASGYFPAVDATWSFSRQRDANGVALPTREGWNHCMCITGYHTDANGEEYGHVENSWSNIQGVGPYHTGPTGWGEPTTAGFWAKASVLDRAIKQGGTYAHSGVTGFPARKLDWFVRGEPKAEPKPFWKLRHDLARADRFALAP
jgi:hypothetical protein